MLVVTGILVDDDTIKLSEKVAKPRGTEVKVEVEEKHDPVWRLANYRRVCKTMKECPPLPREFDEVMAAGIH